MRHVNAHLDRYVAQAGKGGADPWLAAEPPQHLLLGKGALRMAREKFSGMLTEFAQWEAVTLGADFPE